MPKPANLGSDVEEVREGDQLKAPIPEPCDFVALDYQSAELSPLDLNDFGDGENESSSKPLSLDDVGSAQNERNQSSGVVSASQQSDEPVNGQVAGSSSREEVSPQKRVGCTTRSPFKPNGVSANPRNNFQHKKA